MAMNHRFIFVFLFTLLVLAIPAAADPIAKVVAVLGSPTSTGPSGSRKLAADSPVFENDKITVTSGNAQILFVDGTKLVVGPGSTLVISKVLMRGSGNTAQDFSIRALRGTFRFITGKSPKSAYDIQTANATIGIRGTGFDFWVKQATGVALLQGKVRLCSKIGSRSCVDLNPTCEVGTTEKGIAKKLTGQSKIQTLRANLPYIFNQGQLRSAFKLNVSLCQLTFTQQDERLDRDNKVSAPPTCSRGNNTGGNGC
jgi:FecR protein